MIQATTVADEAALYPLHLAVDVLDQLVDEQLPDARALLRGAIALAIHGLAVDREASSVLSDLERLVLRQVDRLDDAELARAARVASQLRRAVGLH